MRGDPRSPSLVHDIGDVLSPENHAELSAAVLRPYVAKHTYWMVLQHGLFQGYYYFDKIGQDANARECHRGHPAFDMTLRFCDEYDQTSFDPDYDTFAIDRFVPMVEAHLCAQTLGRAHDPRLAGPGLVLRQAQIYGYLRIFCGPG